LLPVTIQARADKADIAGITPAHLAAGFPPIDTEVQPLLDIELRTLIRHDVATCSMQAEPLDVAKSMQEHGGTCVVLVEDNRPLGIVTGNDLVRVFAGFYCEESTRQLVVKDLASSPVITATAQTSLLDALKVMESRGIHHLPVTDASGRLNGIVSYRDLVVERQNMIAGHLHSIEQEVQQQSIQLVQAREQLQTLSREDHQFSIPNRRAMEQDLDSVHDIALRYNRPYSVALIDVDLLRKYNEVYGHESGDCSLRVIVDYLNNSLRKTDRLYRFSGGRFLLLLKETLETGACILVQRLQAGINALNIPHQDNPTGHMTVSVGLACAGAESPLADSWHDAFARADAALHRAREKGRNHCVISGERELPGSSMSMTNRSAA
jgi:diguanylate cyclase (GGDEF)-like protein